MAKSGIKQSFSIRNFQLNQNKIRPDPRLKKDMHKRAKRIGFTPSYSIKHPTIKVELQNLGNRRIETDMFKTITMDYENFEFICRYLES